MASGAVLINTLVLLSTACFAGAARPQLAMRASSAVIGVEAAAGSRSDAATPCDQNSDEICSLPGLNGVPHVRMRSGYITVSEVSDRRLWYMVVEREDEQQRQGNTQTQSQTQSQTQAEEGTAAEEEEVVGVGVGVRRRRLQDESPVILWLTGGPGCSSMDAFIYEHGPFSFSYEGVEGRRLPDEGEGGNCDGDTGGEAAEAGAERDGDVAGRPLQQRRSVRLEPNPYSWTKLATVIYVDSPAGAGYSYSGRPDVDYHTNDEYTIADLLTFLEGLTERYPDLATAPFFLAGESYGGVFVPMLAKEVLAANWRRSSEGRPPLVKLRGYSLGNPVTDDPVDGDAQLVFAAQMGYVDPRSWRHMRDVCGDVFWNATRGSECYDAQGLVKDDLWDLNWYDVLEPCTRPPPDRDEHSPAAPTITGGSGTPRRDPWELERRFHWPFTVRLGAPSQQQPAAYGQDGQQQQRDVDQEELHLKEAGRGGGRRLWGPWLRHVAPCMDRSIALDWLNRGEVRSALHAVPASVAGGWQPCSDVLYYRLDTAELVPLHEELVRAGIRALVYSGDHDMVVPHTGTRTWLYDKARLGKVDGPLRPWFMHGQIAGFTARFRSGSGLRFATVKGAGHMVPQSKPAAALHLLRAFLQDEEL